MPRRALSRTPYALAAAALFAVEAGIALFVHDAVVRPLVGDALVVVLVHCVVRACTPLDVVPAALGAFGFACVVEVGQAFDLVDRLGLNGVAVARVVLGTHADWRDVVAYAAGTFATLATERWRARATRPSSPRP